MLTLYGRRSSFNVQKVGWLLEELGLLYDHVEVGGSHGGLESAAFLAMNPHGRVPVLVEDGFAVWESHAILRYLAARHGKAAFWSDDPATRSNHERWMDWSATTLQPDFLMGVFWGFYRTPAPQRDTAAIAASLARCARHFQLLDGILADRPFLGGETLSLADIPAGTALYRYYELEIERPSVPHVAAWYQRLQARPGYRRHVMRPFAELFGRLDF